MAISDERMANEGEWDAGWLLGREEGRGWRSKGRSREWDRRNGG